MKREVLIQALKNSLQNMTLNEFAHLFINETMAIEEFYKLCNGINAGKTISLLFNPHRLETDTQKDDLSVFESLQYDDKLNGLARLYLYNLENGVNDAFYQAIQRGYQNIQYVNEFPPIVARNIISDLSIVNTVKYVLDPCAGWGGRMIGCASLGNVHYVACEPSTKSYEGLMKLGEWLHTLQPTFTYELYHTPYEDLDINTKFDIALTSPPYYNTEHYSDEKTNSLNRYNTLEEWVYGFYKPLILNTVSRLKDNAVFVLNIGDRIYPLSMYMESICDADNLYHERIKDYLSGNGEGKEKFYVISKHQRLVRQKKLF